MHCFRVEIQEGPMAARSTICVLTLCKGHVGNSELSGISPHLGTHVPLCIQQKLSLWLTERGCLPLPCPVDTSTQALPLGAYNTPSTEVCGDELPLSDGELHSTLQASLWYL